MSEGLMPVEVRRIIRSALLDKETETSMYVSSAARSVDIERSSHDDCCERGKSRAAMRREEYELLLQRAVTVRAALAYFPDLPAPSVPVPSDLDQEPG